MLLNKTGLLLLTLLSLSLGGCFSDKTPESKDGGSKSSKDDQSKQVAVTPPPHDHSQHPTHEPVKPERPLIALGKKPKTVDVLIIAAMNNANHGMNFNGFSKGKAAYTIPLGWTVNVTFKNASAVPHSVMVVEQEAVSELQLGESYFDGAHSPDPKLATAPKNATFSFVASETGEYAFACGFPTHAANGHWIGLNISKEAKTPVLKLPDKTIPAK